MKVFHSRLSENDLRKFLPTRAFVTRYMHNYLKDSQQLIPYRNAHKVIDNFVHKDIGKVPDIDAFSHTNSNSNLNLPGGVSRRDKLPANTLKSSHERPLYFYLANGNFNSISITILLSVILFPTTNKRPG